ncbi:MAG: glycosyltransferase [Actinobacteria bacterium]|nr:glycosyltransferase [Actinomycetota bacterium]
MTKLSIVTATYNRVNELKKNILSVANQSLKDKEHIIIDNLSNDGTDELINDYSKKADYPIIYIREKDSGPYDALNKGIKISNGEWVHTLHSDDCYYNNENLEVILNGDVENIDILACAILVKDTGSLYSENSLWIPKYNDKINHYGFPHTGMIIRKSFYESNGYYNTNFKIISDAIFVIENMPKAKYFIIETPLVIMDDKGISNKISLRRTYERLICTIFYHKFPLGYKIKTVFLVFYWDIIMLLKLIKNKLKKKTIGHGN